MANLVVSELTAPAPKVSVFVVAFNSAACIDECVEAIGRASKNQDCEILFVDNGDGSTERRVAARFPHVTIVPSRGNVGFAAGNNMLAKAAKSDLFLLVNPDMVLSPGAIDELVAASQRYPEAAAWGGVSLGKNGFPDTGNALSVPSLFELLSVALGRSAVGGKPVPGVDSDAEVDVLMGGLVMFSKSAWDAANGLDERFFLYCEEVDLFYRLRKMGYTFWRVARATGMHDAAHGQAFSPRRQLYRTTGIIEFARHHWSAPKIWLAILLIWIAAIARLLAGKLFGHWRTRLRQLGEANAIIASRPHLWMNGYDPDKGLLVQLARTPTFKP